MTGRSDQVTPIFELGIPSKNGKMWLGWSDTYISLANTVTKTIDALLDGSNTSVFDMIYALIGTLPCSKRGFLNQFIPSIVIFNCEYSGN